MKPPTDREKEAYEALMNEMKTNEKDSEEDIKAKIAKRYGMPVEDLDMVVVKVMAYAL